MILFQFRVTGLLCFVINFGIVLMSKCMLYAMLEIRLPSRIGVDNTQAIAAINNGYSKKLKSLNRQYRVSICAMNELYLDPEAALEVEYVKTDRGRLFYQSAWASSVCGCKRQVGNAERTVCSGTKCRR